MFLMFFHMPKKGIKAVKSLLTGWGSVIRMPALNFRVAAHFSASTGSEIGKRGWSGGTKSTHSYSPKGL